jgi:hypothetical protein
LLLQRLLRRTLRMHGRRAGAARRGYNLAL